MTQHRSTDPLSPDRSSADPGLDPRSQSGPDPRPDGAARSPQRGSRSRLRWRVLDLVVLAVLAAACGVLFWAWSSLVYPVSEALTVGYPPAGGLLVGGWLLAGPLGALIIRRPGAALACELLAASFQGLLGTTFGATVVISGLIQGAAAEVVFLSSGYRRFGPAVAIASGALAGALGTLSECLIYYYEWPGAHQAVYVVLGTASGAVIAGLAMWLLVRALRATGVLSGLASGR